VVKTAEILAKVPGMSVMDIARVSVNMGTKALRHRYTEPGTRNDSNQSNSSFVNAVNT
jgi:hypothetical protein